MGPVDHLDHSCTDQTTEELRDNTQVTVTDLEKNFGHSHPSAEAFNPAHSSGPTSETRPPVPEAEKDRQNESRADPPQCFDTQDLSEDTTDSGRDTLL